MTEVNVTVSTVLGTLTATGTVADRASGIAGVSKGGVQTRIAISRLDSSECDVDNRE